jgi:DNA-directed RNA polymerase specialized sigma24 family protein
MRKPEAQGWFVDLVNTCDEVLLLLAREAHCQAAPDELTCRYWQLFKTDLPHWVRRHRLTSWELEDAHQQAFFWIQEAMRAVDPVQLSLPRGSSFQTFLNRIFRLRLLDFLRSLRRNRRRFRPVEVPDDWASEAPRANNLACKGRREALLLQLENALSLLDSASRALWHELSQGKRLCDLPHVLGISYRTLKRRWRKLREQLLLAFCHLKE